MRRWISRTPSGVWPCSTGEAELAARLWQEARDLYVAVDVAPGIAESAARLALSAKRRGDVQRAREWLDEARVAAERAGDPESLEYVREVQAVIEK